MAIEQVTGSRRTTTVDLPVSGKRIRISRLSAGRAMALDELTRKVAAGEAKPSEIVVHLFAAVVVGDKGERLYDEQGGAAELDEMDIEDADALMKAIHSFSKPQKPKAEAVETAVGNSEPTTSAVSP